MNPDQTIRVGDRVRIEDVYFQARRHCIGREGVVTSTDLDGSVYLRIEGEESDVCATRFSKVTDAPASVSNGGADTPILPAANLAAATFAHNLLGDSADLDKLIGVAEFAMDRRTLGRETTGTVPVPASVLAETPSEPLADWEKELLNGVGPTRPADRVILPHPGPRLPPQQVAPHLGSGPSVPSHPTGRIRPNHAPATVTATP